MTAKSPKDTLFWEKQRMREFPSTTIIKQILYTDDEPTLNKVPKRTYEDNIYLELTERESLEFFGRFIVDVLHDNNSERGDAILRKTYENFLEFIQLMLKSMCDVHNIVIDDKKLKDYAIKINSLIRTNFTTTDKAFPEDDTFPSINETDVVDKIIASVKATSITDNKVSTDYIANNVKTPVEVMYDQGNQTIAAEHGKFYSVHIGIVNFMDQGDSYRSRNNILSALREFTSDTVKGIDCRKRTDIVSKCFELPGVLKDALIKAGVDETSFVGSLDQVFVELNEEAVMNRKPTIPSKLYLAFLYDSLVKGGLLESHKDPAEYIKDLYDLRSKAFRKGEIKTMWKDWIAGLRVNAANAVVYLIHSHPVRIKLMLRLGDIAVPFMDIKYNLDEQSRPFIKLAKHKGNYLFYDTFSAADVTKWVKNAPFVPATKKTPSYQKDLFVACLMKFVGDFAQVLYSFYNGMIFASGDRSCISVALFIMKVLCVDRGRLENFKLNTSAPKSKDTAEAYEERLKRGLGVLALHASNAAGYRYFMDSNAATNVLDMSKSAEVDPSKRFIDQDMNDKIEEHKMVMAEEFKKWADLIGAQYYGKHFLETNMDAKSIAPNTNFEEDDDADSNAATRLRRSNTRQTRQAQPMGTIREERASLESQGSIGGYKKRAAPKAKASSKPKLDAPAKPQKAKAPAPKQSDTKKPVVQSITKATNKVVTKEVPKKTTNRKSKT